MHLKILQSWSKLEKTLLALSFVLFLGMFIIPLALLPFRNTAETSLQLPENTKKISLGTIRSSFPGQSKRIVVLTAEILVSKADKDFLDEIAVKKGRLTTAVETFIKERAQSGTKNELEPLLKAGLKDTLNSMLFLGKLDEVKLKNFEIIE